MPLPTPSRRQLLHTGAPFPLRWTSTRPVISAVGVAPERVNYLPLCQWAADLSTLPNLLPMLVPSTLLSSSLLTWILSMVPNQLLQANLPARALCTPLQKSLYSDPRLKKINLKIILMRKNPSSLSRDSHQLTQSTERSTLISRRCDSPVG